MKYKILSAIALALSLTGCDKIDTGEESVFEVDKKQRVDFNLSFTIDSVSEYRCPSDVVCIWAGDVDVYLRFDEPFTQTDTIIRLNNRDYNPLKIDGFTFKLIGVDPYPVSTKVTQQHEFRIKMIITEE